MIDIITDSDGFEGEDDEDVEEEEEAEEIGDIDHDDDEEEEEEEEEQIERKPVKSVAEEKVEPKPVTVVQTPSVKVDPDIQAIIANRNQKRKKKEARESDKGEPLYCFCQQVSYGEMVACDGEVI